MGYVIAVALAYLLGSSSMAFYLAKLNKVDIRKKGSGNLGASNATVLLGWGAGVLVALHDIGKGILAVLLAKWFFPELPHVGAAAGVASVLGHIFPFYLKFKGGKGLATFVGVLGALDWRVAVGVSVLVFLITVVTDFIALGTISASVAGPLAMWFVTRSLMVLLILSIAGAVMIFKHRDNLVRIRNKTEIGLRSTAKGENRVK